MSAFLDGLNKKYLQKRTGILDVKKNIVVGYGKISVTKQGCGLKSCMHEFQHFLLITVCFRCSLLVKQDRKHGALSAILLLFIDEDLNDR